MGHEGNIVKETVSNFRSDMDIFSNDNVFVIHSPGVDVCSFYHLKAFAWCDTNCIITSELDETLIIVHKIGYGHVVQLSSLLKLPEVVFLKVIISECRSISSKTYKAIEISLERLVCIIDHHDNVSLNDASVVLFKIGHHGIVVFCSLKVYCFIVYCLCS